MILFKSMCLYLTSCQSMCKFVGMAWEVICCGVHSECTGSSKYPSYVGVR